MHEHPQSIYHSLLYICIKKKYLNGQTKLITTNWQHNGNFQHDSIVNIINNILKQSKEIIRFEQWLCPRVSTF